MKILLVVEIPNNLPLPENHPIHEFEFEGRPAILIDNDDIEKCFKELLQHAIDTKKNFSAQKQKLGA